MTDLINQVQKEQDKLPVLDDEDEFQPEETTSAEDIEDFNSWAKSQAIKELAKFKNLIDLCDISSLRFSISSLNIQQRRIFDDFIERMVSLDINEAPVFLFIAGNAGTDLFLTQHPLSSVPIPDLGSVAHSSKCVYSECSAQQATLRPDQVRAGFQVFSVECLQAQ